MSAKPSWMNCEDCCKSERPLPFKEIERIAKENGFSSGSQYRELISTVDLSTLCEKCIVITPCSVCKEIIPKVEDTDCDSSEDDSVSIKLEMSNYNKEPICSTCKNIQCYRCGEEGYEKTWYGWIMCEECGMELCNKCGGECDDPCSNCERPCDNCNCSDEEEDETDEKINGGFYRGCACA